jgi:hypothetical protein
LEEGSRGLVSVSGTDRGRDGVVVIILALLVGALVGLYLLRGGRVWHAVLAAVLGALVVVIAITDYGSIKDGATGPARDTVTSGWGIWLVGIAGVVAAGVLTALAVNTARRR